MYHLFDFLFFFGFWICLFQWITFQKATSGFMWCSWVPLELIICPTPAFEMCFKQSCLLRTSQVEVLQNLRSWSASLNFVWWWWETLYGGWRYRRIIFKWVAIFCQCVAKEAKVAKVEGVLLLRLKYLSPQKAGLQWERGFLGREYEQRRTWTKKKKMFRSCAWCWNN